jgi:hypothetical protein
MAPTLRTPSRSPKVPDVTSIRVSAVLSSARRPMESDAAVTLHEILETPHRPESRSPHRRLVTVNAARHGRTGYSALRRRALTSRAACVTEMISSGKLVGL